MDSLNTLYQDEKNLNLKYLQIVEKTNENLNLNWTPLNSFFAIIGIILTIISLVTILLAFGNRNQVNKLLKHKSKDFNDKMDEKVQKTQFIIQSKFDKVGATINEFFKENKPNSQEAKNFMFDMIGDLEEIKKFVNKELNN